MQHIARRFSTALRSGHRAGATNLALYPYPSRYSTICAGHRIHQSTAIPAAPEATISQAVPHIIADQLNLAKEGRHVRNVSEHLEQDGILKISLRFPDESSQYLENLVVSLHQRHGHGLPLSHSASKGWFWDVRPQNTSFQTQNHQARSETMEDFPWHTDCSYEESPPRFFALHVLQPDRYGGGTLSVMKVDQLYKLLSPATRDALFRPEYQISIPPEFVKQPDQRHIIGSVLAIDRRQGQTPMVRFREEIVTPLSDEAARALAELKQWLRDLEAHRQFTLHLTAADLPQNTIVLMDNHRWLHARNIVKDPARHLRRVRWDAKSFPRG